MPVRKTESRIPVGFLASDLGEASIAADGRCALVSLITSPLGINRENVYVVFVTDDGLAGQAQSFDWIFAENDAAPTTQSTQVGEAFYSPQQIGSLSITVRLLDAASTELANLTLAQTSGSLQVELEEFIAAAGDSPGPGAADPDASRELVNDYYPFLQAITLPPPDAADVFKQFVFGMVMDSVIRSTPTYRKQLTEDLAQALEDASPETFAHFATQGVGVCRIRLALLAMMPAAGAPLLPWTELPQPASQNACADEKLRESLAALDEPARIDLFNLARFPKTAIAQCGRMVVALRDHYFSGTNFTDVVTGMSGTRAVWIIKHFRQGPLIT